MNVFRYINIEISISTPCRKTDKLENITVRNRYTRYVYWKHVTMNAYHLMEKMITKMQIHLYHFEFRMIC